MRYSPIFLFGTKPKGDICRLENGGTSNGTSIRPALISLKKNALNISEFSLADFKFLLYLYSRLPTYGILKPNLKPVRRKYFPFHYIRVTSVQISPPL
jgi:hypothetical protein